MAEARRRLWEAGFTDALLWVLDGNDRAARFYEGEGWTRRRRDRVEEPYGVVSNVQPLPPPALTRPGRAGSSPPLWSLTMPTACIQA